jgi:outer membrane protein
MRVWPIIFAFSAFISHQASSQDLLTAWQHARKKDPALAVIDAQRGSALTLDQQAKAIWRPNILTSFGAGLSTVGSSVEGAQFSAPDFGTSNQVNFKTSIDQGDASRLQVNFIQPIFNSDKLTQSKQLENTSDVLLEQAKSLEQAAMLDVVNRYFEVLLANKRLEVFEALVGSAKKTAEKSQEKFRIGDESIINSLEAKSHLEQLLVEVLSYQSNRILAEKNFEEKIGIKPENLSIPSNHKGLPLSGELINWLDASKSSPMMKMAALDYARFQLELKRFNLAVSPSVDWVMQLNHDQLQGSGDFGDAKSKSEQTYVGLQVSLPLYTGGMRSAQKTQASYQVLESQANLTSRRQMVEQSIRSAWFDLNRIVAQIEALTWAKKTAQKRLDATRIGYDIGERTVLDVLNAENNLSMTDLAIFEAQVQRIKAALLLASVAGVLDEAMLAQINQEFVQK